MDMNEMLAALNKAESESKGRSRVYYGYFTLDKSVVARIGADESETFGRLNKAGEFIPFTQEDDANFKAEHRAHFTKIFDKKTENNVLHFPTRRLRSV